MDRLKNDEIRSAVRQNYGKIAAGSAGCGCSSSSCCGAPGDVTAKDISLALGYSSEDVTAVPEGANMGLGCGNPQAIASLRSGETVLDLGSGGGFDCFLAARAVGDKGHVIGVDMTPEMVTKSRRNAGKASLGNIDFRLGEMENLPVADGIVDVIISNCVINLSPEKERVLGSSGSDQGNSLRHHRPEKGSSGSDQGNGQGSSGSDQGNSLRHHGNIV